MMGFWGGGELEVCFTGISFRGLGLDKVLLGYIFIFALSKHSNNLGFMDKIQSKNNNFIVVND